MKNFNNAKNKSKFFYINYQIRAKKVLLIDAENNKIGIVSINDALQKAKDSSLDLVQFSNEENPLCKIINYSKFKYDLSKKEKLAKKKQKESAIKIKEIKFRPSTSIGDLKVKANNAIKNLEDGYRIKIIVAFKGRELAHKELGHTALNTFISLIPNFSLLEDPVMSGKFLTVIGIIKQES